MAMFVFVAVLLLAVVAAGPTGSKQKRCQSPLMPKRDGLLTYYPPPMTDSECKAYWNEKGYYPYAGCMDGLCVSGGSIVKKPNILQKYRVIPRGEFDDRNEES